jgi:hypothetical protein
MRGRYTTAITWELRSSGLLGSVSGNFLLTFRDNPSVPSSEPPKMGPMVCPVTSIRNYHYSSHNNIEVLSSHPLRGGRMKSRTATTGLWLRVTGVRWWRSMKTSVQHRVRGSILTRLLRTSWIQYVYSCIRPTRSTHTHTHSAVAFQTRRVTSKCNYPRTTIIDCLLPGLQPCSRLKLGKYAFSYTHTKTAHWMRCAWSLTRQASNLLHH